MPEHSITTVIPLPWQSPVDVFSAVADEPWALFLDSQSPEHPGSRYSVIAIRPERVFEATEKPEKMQDGHARNTFDVLLRKFNDITLIRKKVSRPPFQGGFAGYFFFEAGHAVDLIPLPQTHGQPTPSIIPLYSLGFYPVVAIYDHHRQQAFLCALPECPDAVLREMHTFFVVTKNPPSAREVSVNLQPQESSARFREKVDAVRDYIAAGDICQANISQQFAADVPAGFSAWAAFLKLRQHNPAPYAAYFRTPREILISCSPEQFLSCENNILRTRPIKGTTGMAADAVTDARQREELLRSEKDLAENRMIVDLLRHDLSRHCLPGSVTVPQFAGLESFRGLHHLVSTVQGTLKPGSSAFQAFLAAFPGGSITGAPKRRAIEIIHELEGTLRGAYCGSLGYWGAGGSMDSNILIRTLVLRDNRLTLNTGCGITWASDPEQEYQESLAKAAAIRKALQAS